MFEIEVKNGALVLNDKVKAAAQKYKDAEITIQEMKNDNEEFKEAVLNAMKENGITSAEIPVDDGVMSVTVKAAFERVSADTKKMKEEGIFDLYSKTSKVKESLVVSFK